jgi:hypothetical protein
MLAGEMDAALRGDNGFVQEGILARVEQGECPAGEFVIVPHLGSAGFELLNLPL